MYKFKIVWPAFVITSLSILANCNLLKSRSRGSSSIAEEEYSSRFENRKQGKHFPGGGSHTIIGNVRQYNSDEIGGYAVDGKIRIEDGPIVGSNDDSLITDDGDLSDKVQSKRRRKNHGGQPHRSGEWRNITSSTRAINQSDGEKGRKDGRKIQKASRFGSPENDNDRLFSESESREVSDVRRAQSTNATISNSGNNSTQKCVDRLVLCKNYKDYCKLPLYEACMKFHCPTTCGNCSSSEEQKSEGTTNKNDSTSTTPSPQTNVPIQPNESEDGENGQEEGTGGRNDDDEENNNTGGKGNVETDNSGGTNPGGGTPGNGGSDNDGEDEDDDYGEFTK